MYERLKTLRPSLRLAVNSDTVVGPGPGMETEAMLLSGCCHTSQSTIDAAESSLARSPCKLSSEKFRLSAVIVDTRVTSFVSTERRQARAPADLQQSSGSASGRSVSQSLIRRLGVDTGCVWHVSSVWRP